LGVETLNQSTLTLLILDRYRDRHALVCLHHPPVPIGSSWMDGMMLENPEELFPILDSWENVRAVIWGHIHQEFRARRQGVILYGSPSTCIQFRPGSDSYVKDTQGPGYSAMALFEDGRIAIRSERIGFP